MKKKTFITPEMSNGRLSECVEITSLSSEFRLNGDAPFTLFIHPKAASDTLVDVFPVEPYAGEGFRDVPFVLDAYNEYYLSAIAEGGIDLTKYRVWWATGGAAKVAETPTPPGKSLLDIKPGDNIRGVKITFTNTDKVPVFEPMNEAGEQVINCDNLQLAGATYEEGGTMVAISINNEDTIPFYADGHGWVQTTITIPDDQDYIVTSNSMKPHSEGNWGFDYTAIEAAPKKTLLDVKIGDNLRGKTVTFTNTSLAMPAKWGGEGEMSIGEELPDFIGIHAASGESSGVGKVAIIAGDMGGEEGDLVFIFGDADVETQVWNQTSYTFPDTKDIIVSINTLSSHDGNTWGFDYTTIE